MPVSPDCRRPRLAGLQAFDIACIPDRGPAEPWRKRKVADAVKHLCLFRRVMQREEEPLVETSRRLFHGLSGV